MNKQTTTTPLRVKAETTWVAAIMIRNNLTPLEIEISSDLEIPRFMSGVYYYLKARGMWAQMSDAKRTKPTIYVAKKGKV